MGSDASRVASSPSCGSGSFSPLGPSRGGPGDIFLFHSMPALLHIGISTTSGGLRVECLQPSMDVSGRLHVSSSSISSSGFVQVSGRICQLILVAPCWMEAPWLPTVLNMLTKCSSEVPHLKRCHCGCLGGPGAQGSAIFLFNPLAAQ